MRAPLNVDRITPLLRETAITSVEVVPVIESTNATVAAAGQPGAALIAEHQLAGRGRVGREWQEVPLAGLAVSVLLPAPAVDVAWMPLLTGLALADAIEEVTGYRPVLKWPNDVLDPGTGRKLAGILAELTPAGVVVGAGLNVLHTEAELPVETAISLALVEDAAGSPAVPAERLDRDLLAGTYLRELAARHTALVAGGERAAQAKAEYQRACTTKDLHVDVDAFGTSQRVWAEGVDDQGRLVISWPSGRATVSAGDVRHVRPAAQGPTG